MGALILTHNQISHMFDHEMGPKSLRKGVFQVQALRRSRSCADQISAKKPVKDRPVILKILEVWQGTMWCPTALNCFAQLVQCLTLFSLMLQARSSLSNVLNITMNSFSFA